tara:strand:- start:23524 stop:23664 length:141 start_codon:yes stop_codon:yes gene_type:complete
MLLTILCYSGGLGVGVSGFTLRRDEAQLTVGKIGHSTAASWVRFLE